MRTLIIAAGYILIGFIVWLAFEVKHRRNPYGLGGASFAFVLAWPVLLWALASHGVQRVKRRQG